MADASEFDRCRWALLPTCLRYLPTLPAYATCLRAAYATRMPGTDAAYGANPQVPQRAHLRDPHRPARARLPASVYTLCACWDDGQGVRV
eukprot:693340-Rhodomonas_salina.2